VDTSPRQLSIMNRAVIFFLGCTLSSLLFAANDYGTGDHVVHVRDTEAQLISAMGEPTRKVAVEDSRGGHQGDYYIYALSQESVRFYIQKGRVVEITVIRGS
jgi:hypothetical protein